MIDDSVIRQVHDRADILDVVTGYNVQLKRVGANWKGCCPFHNERTPSFIVSPGRGTFHCFGCKAHGDAIAFVMNIDGKTYPEAIEYLAGKLGITVTHNERQQTDEEREAARRRESMKIAVEAVQDWFVAQLQADTPEAENARRYAYGRWGEEYCKTVGIGFAPDSWDALVDHCKSRCISTNLLVDAGALRFSDKAKKLYSFFRGRVTIPIADRYGKVIAFTARDLGGDPDHKYINSPDSDIFKKGSVVFGLRTAQRNASRNNRFIIVEGAPDVLRLQSDEVGLTETVATLGTAWNDEQFKQLQRYTSKLVFLPDADPPKEGEDFGPGIKAVMKNGLQALHLGFDVYVREIPVGRKTTTVPLFDFEIEELQEQILKKKVAAAKKDGVPKKERDNITLTDAEVQAIPRTRELFIRYEKQDPDTYVTSGDAFNALEEVPFPLWYGTKVLSAAKTDLDKAKAVDQIASEVLVHVADDNVLNYIQERLSQVFGRLKLWRDATRKAVDDRDRERRRKAREALTGDEAAMRELGIIVKNGCYCSYDKEGDLERWSNFTMEPLFHIIDGENAIRIFRLKNERGSVREIEFRQDELISLTAFQRRVESSGFFVFKGDVAKLQNLKEYLYSITDSAVQLTKMGWNGTEEVYAFGDGILADNVLYPINDLGIVKIGDRTFYLPAFSKMHIDQKDAFQFERSFSCRQHGDVSLYEYVDRMVTVFGDNAKVGFAFVLATLFLDIVKLSSKRLALLNIFGRKGTGKTELGTALMSFFIRQNDPPSLATTSLASLNDMLSCAENNLVHLDEYKNDLDFRKIEILKQIWGGSGQTKKNMDGDKKVQRTFVRSSVVLSGQDAPIRDDALFSRVIHLSYSEATFSKEAKRNFEEFQAISAKGASHLTIQLLKLRKLFEADYATHYAVCKRELIAALADDNVEDRLLNNWLAPLAAFHTVQTSLDLPYTYTDLFNICVGGIRRQNEQLKKNSDIAVFWNLLDSNHMQGRIVAKAHFILRHRSQFKRTDGTVIDFERDKMLLYLNYKGTVEVLGQRVSGSNVVGKLDIVSLESYLRTHPAFLGTKQERFWKLTANGTPEYTYEVRRDGDGTQQARRVVEVRPMAFVFDYDLLKESYDLNLQTETHGENDLSEEDLPPAPASPPPARQEELPF